MIIGAHAIIYSKDAEATRAFLRDTLRLRSVDAGGGWLIFALPPAELAAHPDAQGGRHELYLMCDDVHRTVAELTAALLAYKVLVFRSQHLDDPGQTRFASLFGPLTAAHPTIPSLDGDEHVLPVEGGEGARAPDDYGDLPRRLHRVTVAGDVPVGADGRRSYVIEGDEAAHYTPQAA